MDGAIERSAFQTRARTIDHLGREQIADCPTAISELWKNAFDAYARSVELNIYDGAEPVAAITDDGHGMTRDEFVQRWLVVGTESKAATNWTPIEDRNNLRLRPKQGQKGIGRLSCANLGPLLLLISKRRRDPFFAALVDWRLFENPFINLSDIFIPTVEFTEYDMLFGHLPGLANLLSQNVTGGLDGTPNERIREAWAKSDELHEQEGREGDAPRMSSKDILSTIYRMPFEPRHFREWSASNRNFDHGTTLLISGINYDLRVQLDETAADASAKLAKARFFETLSSFVDPFVDPTDPAAARRTPEFTYLVRVWEGNKHRAIVGSEKQFDRRQVDDLEHRIEGQIDSAGTFSGRVKAFGELLPDECVIDPPKDLSIPRRRDSEVGPLTLYIASMEFTSANTTHTPAEFRRFQELAERYSGFLVFRDGLRVLPYGRTDNDFFEIESRRSKNAGREFWNHRQMFGCISITRDRNPNLKDKAGREGLIDNRAAKTLKALIANILMQSARRYFGSASEIRRELLPEISAENKKRRVNEARNLLRKRQRREFREKLERFGRDLPQFARDIQDYTENLDLRTEAHISDAQRSLDRFREQLRDYRLPGTPKNLGILEDAYADYRALIRSVHERITEIDGEIERRVEQIKPTKPGHLLQQQLESQATSIRYRIRRWSKSIDTLQKDEHRRIREVVRERNNVFHTEASPILRRFNTGNLPYVDASRMLNELKQRIDEENRELFVSYIGALESLHESIDLEHLATFGMEQISELRTELERLNSLAQLGIAVEIAGHELESYDEIIGFGLKRLPKQVRKTDAVKDIEFGYEGLTDQLRFLSPLRLAGQKVQSWVTGIEIAKYLRDFFGPTLTKSRITFRATDKFLKFRVFDQRSRLYPVFMNLLNNSIYWLSVTEYDNRMVVFDVVASEVVVSDNGPGIAPEDVPSLFTLFFTRRIYGGRGVGLYLCRANLAAGGHQIEYQSSTTNMPLSGANFVISFRGAEFNGG